MRRDSFHVVRPLIGEVGIKASAHGKVPRAMPRCRCLSARGCGELPHRRRGELLFL